MDNKPYIKPGVLWKLPQREKHTERNSLTIFFFLTRDLGSSQQSPRSERLRDLGGSQQSPRMSDIIAELPKTENKPYIKPGIQYRPADKKVPLKKVRLIFKKNNKVPRLGDECHTKS